MAMSAAERRAHALREVHHARPTGLQAVVTLELSHPAMDEPARVVADNMDLEAALETGETVTFKAMAFQSIGPAQSESRWPEIALSLDGVADIIEPYLDQSLLTDHPVTVTFREYLRERAHEGPGQIISGLELDNSTSNDFTVTGTAGYYGLDRKFGRYYDPSVYPGVA